MGVYANSLMLRAMAQREAIEIEAINITSLSDYGCVQPSEAGTSYRS